MRIALLTDGIYPYVMGGMQKHSFYLARFFALNGVHVDLYHTGPMSAELKELSCFTGEEKKYISAVHIPFPAAGKLPGHYIRESYKYAVAVYKAYAEKEQPVDFIYVQGFSGWEIIRQKKKGQVFPPVAVHFHGLEMFQKPAGLRSRLEQVLMKKPVLENLRAADYAFSLGGRLTGILKEQGIAAEKILGIPLGIDKEWIGKNITTRENKKTRFVFVGRYERRKALPELNAAISALAGTGGFEFHFIGPIPPEVQLQLPEVKYHGSISDPLKVKEIIHSCDVLVCASYSEGMPNVIVEAMAGGLAVIATDVGAISVLVSERTGRLIPDAAPATIEKALKEFIGMDPALLEQKKENARTLIENQFTWDRIIQQTLQTISGITGRS